MTYSTRHEPRPLWSELELRRSSSMIPDRRRRRVVIGVPT
jgi:hypothetical protein